MRNQTTDQLGEYYSFEFYVSDMDVNTFMASRPEAFDVCKLAVSNGDVYASFHIFHNGCVTIYYWGSLGKWYAKY